MGFNQRELRLIRARPYSSLLMVTHMSHGSSQTAVSSADCGSRDLNAHFTRARTETSIYISKRRRKKNQTVLFLDLIADSSQKRVLLTTNRSSWTDREKIKN